MEDAYSIFERTSLLRQFVLLYDTELKNLNIVRSSTVVLSDTVFNKLPTLELVENVTGVALCNWWFLDTICSPDENIHYTWDSGITRSAIEIYMLKVRPCAPRHHC